MGRMVEQTGLDERLRQHARHSGMLIGVSMALVIALTIGAFVWIFFRIDPLLSDFTGRTGAAKASPVAVIAASPAPRVATRPAGPSPVGAAASPGAGQPAVPTPTALAGPSPTATPGFVPTHEVADFGERVNLRSGPTASSGRIALLSPGTKLKFLNEQEPSGDVLWMKFQTERGDVGWVRLIDVRPIR